MAAAATDMGLAEELTDQRLAEWLGAGTGLVVAKPPSRRAEPPTGRRKRGIITAGRSNRNGTTLLISRPRDFWPWLDRDKRERLAKGSALLAFASALILLLAAGQGYVSWFAQFRFVQAAKHAPLASGIEALGLDTGAVIFALLALALVRLERRAIVERILNVGCAAGSLAMNVLAADLHSVRSMVIYALPSALYATCSDRLIAVVRRHALSGREDEEAQKSAWQLAARALGCVLRVTAVTLLYAMRFVLAFGSTFSAARRQILALTPLPPAPYPDREEKRDREGWKPHQPKGRKRAPTKKSVLREEDRKHADYGKRERASRVAAELAPMAMLQPGTARTYLYAHLDEVAGVKDAAGRDAE